ncbi:MAG: phytoene/squalene synthase family protein [Phycisphaerales bacterium]
MSISGIIPTTTTSERRAMDGAGLVVPTLAGVPAPVLDAAYASCRDITRRAARNFYYGLCLTPEPRRSAVYSVYAWMRAADDQVDEAGTIGERRARLTSLRERTERVLAGDLPGPDAEPFWTAFAATLASYPIDHAFVLAMLDGLAEDLDHTGYATREDLERYCYRVGSTVGLTCIAIWGLRPDADAALATEKSIRRGKAFQLTNILRDIGQDFDDLPRRVYVPASDLAANGLSAPQLRSWAEPERCRALVQGLSALAREHYRASAGLEDLIDAACAPALWGMTRIYSDLLRMIEADPASVVSPQRVRLSSARKGLIALSAVIRQRTQAWTVS